MSDPRSENENKIDVFSEKDRPSFICRQKNLRYFWNYGIFINDHIRIFGNSIPHISAFVDFWDREEDISNINDNDPVVDWRTDF